MENIFLSFFNTSIIACLPLLAVVFARFAFRRMPKNVTCLLWILVALRLALPFSLSAPFSLLPEAEPVKTEVLTLSEGEKERAPEVKPVINNAPVSTISNESEPAGNDAPIADNSPVVDGAATPSEAPAPVIDSREEPASSAVTDVKSEESADLPVNVIGYAGIAWIAGMVCMALYGVIGYIRLRRRTRVCEEKEKDVWLCDHITEPFILGVFRPRIMLPSSIGPEDERYVLLHERAHISRGDHIWRVLAFALLALHWYNPLVWVAFFLFSRDTELACDERVVRENGEAIKKPYARTLIAYSAMPHKAFSGVLSFGGKGIAAKLKNMLHYKKPAVWMCVAFALTCAVIALCFMTVPAEGDDSEPVDAPTETAEATSDTEATEPSETTACTEATENTEMTDNTEPTENTDPTAEATEPSTEEPSDDPTEPEPTEPEPTEPEPTEPEPTEPEPTEPEPTEPEPTEPEPTEPEPTPEITYNIVAASPSPQGTSVEYQVGMNKEIKHPDALLGTLIQVPLENGTEQFNIRSRLVNVISSFEQYEAYLSKFDYTDKDNPETMIENQPEVQKYDYDYFKDNTIVIIYTFDTVRSITRADSELCISMNVDLDILEENRKKAEEEENIKKELGLADIQMIWNVGKPPRACIILEFKKSELEGIDTIGFHCIAKE